MKEPLLQLAPFVPHPAKFNYAYNNKSHTRPPEDFVLRLAIPVRPRKKK